VSGSTRDLLSILLDGGRWPAVLSPPAEIEALLDGADSLPPVDAIGFEVRLDGHPGVDFGVGLGSSEKRRARLASALSQRISDPSSWSRVAQFCTRWCAHGTLEQRLVTHAFLEFDADAGQRLSSPSLFLGLGGTRARDDESVARILGALLREKMREETRSLLLDRLAFLPEGSILLHVGVMLGRSDAVRIHAAVPTDAARDYAEEAAGEALADQVMALALRYESDDPVTTLQFEVRPRREAEAVGIELSCPPGTSKERLAGWIDRLVGDGLCSPDRGSALSQWPCDYRSPLDVGGWPCRIEQRISHLKITVRRGRPFRAKAYLTAAPVFRLFGPALS
jgi:hypothetical protein